MDIGSILTTILANHNGELWAAIVVIAISLLNTISTVILNFWTKGPEATGIGKVIYSILHWLANYKTPAASLTQAIDRIKKDKRS